MPNETRVCRRVLIILTPHSIRTTLARLNFDALDPSDSMANFVHNMKLKRGVGFVEVDFVEGSELRP